MRRRSTNNTKDFLITFRGFDDYLMPQQNLVPPSTKLMEAQESRFIDVGDDEADFINVPRKHNLGA